MIKRVRRESVEPVRKRAVLATYASALGFVPAPPALNYVQGYAPGVTEQSAMGTAEYDRSTDTMYYRGKMDDTARAHETGHAFDDQAMSDGDRSYFQRLIHAPAGEWRTGTGFQGGAASPSELFADYYQAAALGIDPRRASVAAYANIGPVRLKRFEAALARLGKRQHLKQYR